MVRTAECACGALKPSAEGEPAIVGAYCCLRCQRRTGSVFGVAAYFPKDKVEIISGQRKVFSRMACPVQQLISTSVRLAVPGSFRRLQYFPISVLSWSAVLPTPRLLPQN